MEVRYIGHAGVLIREGDVLIAFDPFLSGSFYWNGKLNTYKGESPYIGTEQKMEKFIDEFADDITAILISHAHMDHFDPPAFVQLIERNPEIQVFAPYPVIDWLKASSMANTIVTKFAAPIEWHGKYEVEGDNSSLDVYVMPNNGIKKEKLPYRVGYLIRSKNGKGILLPGDAHNAGDWKKHQSLITDVATWCKPIKNDILDYYSKVGNVEKIWVIHWEDFSPGNFDCSEDPNEFIEKINNSGFIGDKLSYSEWKKV